MTVQAEQVHISSAWDVSSHCNKSCMARMVVTVSAVLDCLDKVEFKLEVGVGIRSGQEGHFIFRFKHNFNFPPILMSLTLQNALSQAKAQFQCSL